MAKNRFQMQKRPIGNNSSWRLARSLNRATQPHPFQEMVSSNLETMSREDFDNGYGNDVIWTGGSGNPYAKYDFTLFFAIQDVIKNFKK